MNCTECKSENVIFNEPKNYAKCNDCGNLMMDVAGNWQTFPIDASMRSMMELSLGFQSAPAEPVKLNLADAPKTCMICSSALESIQTSDDAVFCRCTRCGMLGDWNGYGLTPVSVTPPGGGFNPEFQAIFEEKLGFSYKLRKKPIGIVE